MRGLTHNHLEDMYLAQCASTRRGDCQLILLIMLLLVARVANMTWRMKLRSHSEQVPSPPIL